MNNKSAPNEPNLLFFDIESTNLRAPFGFVLCIGYKFRGDKKVSLLSIDDFPLYKKDPTNDKALLKAFAKVYTQADIVCAHYGVRFDKRFINSRLLYHGLPILPPVKFIDTWRLAKDNLAMHSNRLQAIAEFFELDLKTPVQGPQWIKAMAGNKKALKYVQDHCIKDIVVLEQTYEVLSNFQPAFPRFSDDGNCPHCHSDNTQKRGLSWANTLRYQRYSCNDCGKWSRDRKALRDAV